jgi:ADP-ribosylglycohydrolase
VSQLKGIYSTSEFYAPHFTELMEVIQPEQEFPGSGSGYVLDTLRSTKAVMIYPSYEAVVKAAITLGHDTDTTACVAGGIAGLREGLEGIPSRWRTQLRGQTIVAQQWQRLKTWHGLA